jgi:CheY-like chemotaxis protein
MVKILIVEDDRTSRFILEKLLSSRGYEVTASPGGHDALKKLADGLRPDLIISDIMMPSMDGLELAKRISEDPELKDIPIMLCTALHDRETVMNAAKLGIHHYIVKPLEAERVIAQVESLLDERVPVVEAPLPEKK